MIALSSTHGACLTVRMSASARLGALLLATSSLLGCSSDSGTGGAGGAAQAAGGLASTAGGNNTAAGTTNGGAPGGAGSASVGGASGGTGAANGGSGAGQAGTGGGGGSGGSPPVLEDFSFFVTSQAAMVELSANPEGFGGDLSFNGKAGVLGADEICKAIAEKSMPGSSVKGWKAFLSTTTENAIDRISGGPWYDRAGRVVAMDKAGLLHERPEGGDAQVAEDLPNEAGLPNHLDGNPACLVNNTCPDNHDTLTGSKPDGTYDPDASTCEDWTSREEKDDDRPNIGHSWPRNENNGRFWIMDHQAGGCGRSVHVEAGGGPADGDYMVGAGGGYGGIYCFASTR